MKIPVLGIGCTPFGELWHHSLADLLAQSQHEALRDAHLKPSDIDMLFVANIGAELWGGQGHLGALAADVLGVSVPSIRIESACASGGMALAAGVMAIMSGSARVVMISGVEKMTDVDPATVTAGLMGACLRDAEYMAGASFASLFALVTRQYFHTYGIGREHLAAVSVKNHAHALLNPLAHIRKKISIDDVMRSPMIADPLSLLDCSPISDGAATIILGSTRCQNGGDLAGVNIIASSQATDTMTIAARPTLTSFAATKNSAARAFAQAGITPDMVNVAEVHDAFTMAEIIALEDLGFSAPGMAAFQGGVGLSAIALATAEGNALPSYLINPSGGLKAKGHPIGATGIAQAVEIVLQLRGKANARQVPDARFGLTHNMGGIGTTVAVHIFEREQESGL